MGGTVHVIGAGLAGLGAAVALAEAGERVVLSEAAPQAGGRCRSYEDRALGMVIDNGNHLILSGNDAALAYIRRIGGMHALTIARECAFDFADLKTGTRWTLRPGESALSPWIFDPARRVPDTRPGDYLKAARLFFAGPRTTVGERLATEGALYERLWHPLLVAGLNTDPAASSARLAARLIRETLGRGGKACRPVVATGGLSAALVEPALAFLSRHCATVRLGTALKAVTRDETRLTALEFPGETVALGAEDRVVFAVPANVAAALVPEIEGPDEFNAIVNLHFRDEGVAEGPALLGVVGGLTEWLFRYPGRLSVTISAADRLLDTPREDLARRVWAEIATLTGAPSEMPAWQVVRERRATFAATPAQDARRPRAETDLTNLILAGDWTQTGLPATIEGAIRSGRTAAALVRQKR